MRQLNHTAVEPPLLDLRRPSPPLRRAMRIAALIGAIAIAIGVWQVAGALVAPDLMSAEFVQGLKSAARWMVGGMLLLAVGFWDR